MGRVLWLAVAIVAGLALGCARENPESTAVQTPEGSPVTATACRFDGVESAIAAAKGKVVLIDCWATWCGPCVESFPDLVARHRKYAEKGLAVISLSLDDPDDADRVNRFLTRQNARFTNLHLIRDAEASHGMSERLAYRGSIPHAVLFDRQGIRLWAGHPQDGTLERLLEAQLAK